MKILISGNPVHGFQYYGPFLDGADVYELSFDHGSIDDFDGDWWVAPISPVEDTAPPEEVLDWHDDILSSLLLALTRQKIPQSTIDEIIGEMQDYIVNNWGDD